MAEVQSFSIREVVHLLMGEFEISESNLRFWEKEGLLFPGRSPGGHRIYSLEDVERIRLIYKLKTKRYLPLAQIRRFCNSSLSNDQIESHLGDHLDKLFRPLNYDPEFTPLGADSLLERFSLSREFLDQMISAGFLSDQEPYDEDDVRLVELFSSFLSLGLCPEDFKEILFFIERLAEAQYSLLSKVPRTKASCFTVKDPSSFMDEWYRVLFRKATIRVGQNLADAGFFKNMKGNEQ